MAANTVEKDGIRKSSGSRSILENPHVISWPSISNEDYRGIVNALRRDFPAVLSQKIISTKRQKHLKCLETITEVDKIHLEHMRERTEQRSCLAVGINEVTRGLERDQLALVLVSRSLKPSEMTEHLILLGGTRKIPVVGLHDLEPVLQALVNLKKVAAIGFKKQRTTPVYDSLIEFIIPRVPKVVISWVNLSGDKMVGDTTDELKGSGKELVESISEETAKDDKRKDRSKETKPPKVLKKQFNDDSKTLQMATDARNPKKMKYEDNNLKSCSNKDIFEQWKTRNKEGDKCETLNQEFLRHNNSSLDISYITYKPPIIKTIQPVRDIKITRKKKNKKN